MWPLQSLPISNIQLLYFTRYIEKLNYIDKEYKNMKINCLAVSFTSIQLHPNSDL